MNTPTQFLRLALRIDAIACSLFAIGTLIVFAGPTSFREQLNVPSSVLAAAGIVALISVPLLWGLSRRKLIRPVSVWSILCVNAAFAAISLLVLALGLIHPTPAGASVIVAIAILTGVVAELEWIGLQRARVADAIAV